MALEIGTYISDLIATNPASGDTEGQGDDHLRLIKSTLLNTFAAITGAVTATHTELNGLHALTASRAMTTNASGILTPSAVTDVELGYLAGVTSAIQTQLAARLIAANNLSDLISAATARTNLGLGTVALLNAIADANITDVAATKLTGTYTHHTGQSVSPAGVYTFSAGFITGIRSTVSTGVTVEVYNGSVWTAVWNFAETAATSVTGDYVCPMSFDSTSTNNVRVSNGSGGSTIIGWDQFA